MSNLTLQLASPYVSYEEYGRISGLSINTIKKMVYSGRIPIRTKQNPKEKPLINMVALTREASEQLV